MAEDPQAEELDVDSLLVLLRQQKDDNMAIPTCFSSVNHFSESTVLTLTLTNHLFGFCLHMTGSFICFNVSPTKSFQSVAKLKADKIGTVHGRLIVGTAEKIPPSELVDTTGAGDAFIGAVLYGISKHFSPTVCDCAHLPIYLVTFISY